MRTGMEMPSHSAGSYRSYGAHCVEIARDIADPSRKATFIDMARAWLALADLADHNESLQQVVQQQQQPQSDDPDSK